MAEEIKYIRVRFNRDNGQITTLKSSKEHFETFQNLGNKLIGHYLLDKRMYNEFITTDKQFRKDCKMYFGEISKQLALEQKLLDKKHAALNKLINNAKNL